MENVLGTLLSDYDECNPAQSVHIPDCGNNATCVNTNTSYDCVCHDGFINDGTGCISKYYVVFHINVAVVKIQIQSIKGNLYVSTKSIWCTFSFYVFLEF